LVSLLSCSRPPPPPPSFPTRRSSDLPGRAGRGAGAPHAAVGSGARTARRSPAVPLNTRGLGLLALGAAAACGSRGPPAAQLRARDRKSTRLNSSHDQISYAVFCLKKK